MALDLSEGHAGQGSLVLRLDTTGRDYYLVPWRDGRGIVAVVQIDAESGTMASVAVLPKPLERLMVTPDEARQAVSKRLGQRALGRPELVWRPCRETASPLQPVYRVTTEGGGTAFVGVDGSVYLGLTPFGKGG